MHSPATSKTKIELPLSSVPPQREQLGGGQHGSVELVEHALDIAPGTYTFNTEAPELMEMIAGSCRVKLAGENEWKSYGVGESFCVPGNSSFEIEVAGEPYHYVCHFA